MYLFLLDALGVGLGLARVSLDGEPRARRRTLRRSDEAERRLQGAVEGQRGKYAGRRNKHAYHLPIPHSS